jgi:hypothetical protein
MVKRVPLEREFSQSLSALRRDAGGLFVTLRAGCFFGIVRGAGTVEFMLERRIQVNGDYGFKMGGVAAAA